MKTHSQADLMLITLSSDRCLFLLVRSVLALELCLKGHLMYHTGAASPISPSELQHPQQLSTLFNCSSCSQRLVSRTEADFWTSAELEHSSQNTTFREPSLFFSGIQRSCSNPSRDCSRHLRVSPSPEYLSEMGSDSQPSRTDLGST